MMLSVPVRPPVSTSSLEIPKSITFALPSVEMATLSGLRSRWTMLRWWAAPTAESSCCAMSSAWWTEIRPLFWMIDRSDSPSTYSMTMKSEPPSSSKS